jgi:hypothetical protein
MLASLQMALWVIGWLCAAGAFYDLVVIGFFRRLYRKNIEVARERGRRVAAHEFAQMLPLLNRIEQMVSFVTCWALVKGLVALVRSRWPSKA